MKRAGEIFRSLFSGAVIKKGIPYMNKTVMKTVFIPKNGRNDNERYVAVNGKRILVRTGEAVSVPLPFAQVIDHSQRMDRCSDEYIAENRRDD